MTQTGHRKPQRSKRRIPASQRDREARIAVIVVLATAIGLIVIALSGRSSETDAASSDEVQSLAAADATESSVSASSDAAAATDAEGSTPTSSTDSLPDLDVVDDETTAELSSAAPSRLARAP